MALTFLLCLGATAPALAEPLVVAHRGGPALGPENMLSTFEKACLLGVDAVELDIHQSKDGYLFVLHDETLDRTFGRPGRVAEMERKALIEAGVPTLHQALRLLRGRVKLLAEIKHPQGARYEGIENRLVQSLRDESMLEDTVVISFDATSLRLLRELEPTLPTGYLVVSQVDPEQAKRELGITYMAPHYLRLDESYLKAIRAAGLKINVWTVNSEKALRAMIAAGCDTITTDQPERLMQILDRRP